MVNTVLAQGPTRVELVVEYASSFPAILSYISQAKNS